MKKLTVASIVCVAAFAVLSTAARASGVDNFVVTSTYTAGTGSSQFSGQADPITMSFSVPNSVSGGFQDNGVTITVGFGGSTTVVTGGTITFYPLSALGLFDVDFSAGGNAFEWDFFGPQSYNSSNNILLGTFPINSGSETLSLFYEDGEQIGTLDGGTVVVTAGASSTPEPSSLFLLGTGLLGLAPVIRRRFARA
ncbi:MAG: PEP-CTERM sorting domain-containing protein [Candidatus Acidiferrales bacterium]